jgi:NADPH:quinone reductase-like Zn-dependent oxidoreductase
MAQVKCSVGEGVTRWRVGDRVVPVYAGRTTGCRHRRCAHAARSAVRSKAIFKTFADPRGRRRGHAVSLSDAEAATLPIAAPTAGPRWSKAA